ncbi:MAG TPA: hypothetical protein PKD84_04475 [Propionicimonas sp.]|nr:hypothetical protein [Propionicimonas sp.]
MSHPHPHGPEWIISVHDQGVPREDLAQYLSSLGAALAQGGHLTISGQSIDVPAQVGFDLRYERTPHGSLALVVRAEWARDTPGAVASIPLADLRISAADDVK